MRDGNRSANHQGHIESIQELFAADTSLCALFDVIGDAIVAAQNDRTSQAHQLFRFLIQRAVFISLRIEGKKPFDAKMPAPQQLLIHLSAIEIKIVHHQSFRSTYQALTLDLAHSTLSALRPELCTCVPGLKLIIDSRWLT